MTHGAVRVPHLPKPQAFMMKIMSASVRLNNVVLRHSDMADRTRFINSSQIDCRVILFRIHVSIFMCSASTLVNISVASGERAY